MAEVAVKEKDKLILFPNSSDESHITMSEDELQQMIRDVVTAARKKRKKTKTTSLYTCDGRRKPTPASPIQSKEDFKKVVDYLSKNGKVKYRIRNKTLFILGCSIGLRCSDLVNLKTEDVYTQNGKVKGHLEVFERKTGKRNICKIPKMAAEALNEYYDEQHFEISRDEFLFQSQKSGSLNVRSIYAILKNAGEMCNLDIELSTHTMRKTYAMAALKSAEGTQDEGNTLQLLQMKLNHSNERITMRYCKAAQEKMDRMSDRVSDWFDGE